jgi:hypothetical protein
MPIMPRAGFIPLLAAWLLVAVTLQAQLPSNLSQGGLGAGGGGTGRNTGGHSGASRLPGRGHHRHGRAFGGGFIGGGYIDPFWYDRYGEPMIEYETPAPTPPPALPAQIVMPEPERIPTAPKLTEIPVANKAAGDKAAASKPLPPAVFILAGGEKIESRHYLLTADRVQLTVARKRRSIPLEALDLDATLAANQRRGLELHIPASGSEISLGF